MAKDGEFKARNEAGEVGVYQIVNEREGTFLRDVATGRLCSPGSSRLAFVSGDAEARRLLADLEERRAAEPEVRRKLGIVLDLFPEANVRTLHEITQVPRADIVRIKRERGLPV